MGSMVIPLGRWRVQVEAAYATVKAALQVERQRV